MPRNKKKLLRNKNVLVLIPVILILLEVFEYITIATDQLFLYFMLSLMPFMFFRDHLRKDEIKNNLTIFLLMSLILSVVFSSDMKMTFAIMIVFMIQLYILNKKK